MHRSEFFFTTIVYLGTVLGIFMMGFLIIYISAEGVGLFTSISPWDFLMSADWHPLEQPGHFGILTMLLGSLYGSAIALLLGFPLGIGCAVFVCFCLPERPRRWLLAFIDMLAGIPSVIFGFIGLMILVHGMERFMLVSSGECVLSAGILLAIMILPFIVTNCSESMEYSRQLYEDASSDLGVDKWYMLWKIILPVSVPAFSVSLILAFSRAMGETMAVMMVMGNSKLLPSLLGKGETIPSLIALEMGSAEYGSLHYQALYASGMVLILVLILCNLAFFCFRHRFRKDHHI